jgi:hypothetical protein
MVELLPQCHYCHDPNAFLTEEISWTGLKPMQAAAKSTIFQRLVFPRQTSFAFTNFLEE